MATSNAATLALAKRIDTAIDASIAFDSAEGALDAACKALFAGVKEYAALKALRAAASPRYEEKYKARNKKGFNEKQCVDAFNAFWSRAMKRAESQGWTRPKSASKAAVKRAASRTKAAAKSPAKVDKRTQNTKAAGNKGAAAPQVIVPDNVTKIDVGTFRSALDWVLASAERQTLFVAWVDAQKASTTTHKAA